MKIEQHSGPLMHLLRAVERGALAPAPFQRPYVWSQADVLALCESIIAGYPIGSFLVWEPDSRTPLPTNSPNRLGPISLDAKSEHTALLLDGQNRLASLAWFYWEPGGKLPADLSDAEKDTWANGQQLVVNLIERAFEFVSVKESDVGMRMPARAVVDNSLAQSLLRQRYDTVWSASGDAKNEAIKWFDRVCDAFREASLVQVTLRNATPAEARKAFLHICRVGVPMSAEDFDRALAWTA